MALTMANHVRYNHKAYDEVVLRSSEQVLLDCESHTPLPKVRHSCYHRVVAGPIHSAIIARERCLVMTFEQCSTCRAPLLCDLLVYPARLSPSCEAAHIALPLCLHQQARFICSVLYRLDTVTCRRWCLAETMLTTQVVQL